MAAASIPESLEPSPGVRGQCLWLRGGSPSGGRGGGAGSLEDRRGSADKETSFQAVPEEKTGRLWSFWCGGLGLDGAGEEGGPDMGGTLARVSVWVWNRGGGQERDRKSVV